MNQRELRQCVERLADEYGLHWAPKIKRFYGVHQGILVELFEWEGQVTFTFSSPTAQIADEILQDFAGFTHLAEAGVPTEWVKGIFTSGAKGGQNSDCGCELRLDAGQVESIGLVTFELIPQLVAADFHAHGAEPALLCGVCGQNEATTVRLVGYTCTPLCESCRQDLEIQTSGGKLATEQSINWPLVVPTLLVLTALGGFLWGYLQQPHVLREFGFWAMLLPALWAFGLCYGIGYVSGGVTPLLRWSLFASVIVSVLAGNIWGFRTFYIEEQLMPPMLGPEPFESIRFYFKWLPDNWQIELPYLVGGVLGAWIGLRLLKSQEKIDVQ